jgi:HEPN domain-containing protein
MNRADLRRLANDRLADAKALLAARRWTAAYYLAGYAVECGLKSCILADVAATPDVLFEDKRYSEKCWTHNLMQLTDLAGLKVTLAADAAADPDLLANRESMMKWREAGRYERRTRVEAEAFYEAIADKKHGVITWIKQHW